MTSQQELAFEAGSGVAPGELLTAIVSATMVLVVLWVTWIAIGSFKSWQAGSLDFFDLAWDVLRASIVLLVLGFYLR